MASKPGQWGENLTGPFSDTLKHPRNSYRISFRLPAFPKFAGCSPHRSTIFGQNVVGESANLNLVALNYSTANAFNILVELLVTFTLPFGLAIYAWLIATGPPLRRWLGFLMGVQVILFFIALGCFAFPRLSDFVSSQLFAVYAIILSFAKAVCEWASWITGTEIEFPEVGRMSST